MWPIVHFKKIKLKKSENENNNIILTKNKNGLQKITPPHVSIKKKINSQIEKKVISNGRKYLAC